LEARIEMGKEKKKKRVCPICETELDEDEDICPNCGSYIEEPAYDLEDDLDSK
jgi:rRNA maturation endonuclease Nob1